ncbi:cysteine desulfurase family protein [Actibacterium sp. XHP0104]|uniref:cysteine desulfurase family protein n=1 Tax=Actibacterium sp. XHP0104 TaxID=2984335 RepID=UPI0021E7B9F9|nr:cysteine desulfurase family protein [Actibacterium sp. XHP0104]MCV2881225.1 cysteine desulfurase [Actibacterium sp. XHP0104]
MTRTYLDYNATAPLRDEARAAMVAAMDLVGNPSSVHAEGRAAKALVENARAQVAAAVGCAPSEVIFTSGATEAAQMLAHPRPGHDVFVQDTAHDALFSHLKLSDWPERPLGPGHTLAMGLANSETGVITQPPEQIDGQWPYGDTARADWLLLDVTQAVGRIPFAFSWSGADFAILSAHKLGGPKGVGALIVRQGVDIDPLTTGGGQEMGRRSGTENVIGIAGFGAAAEAAARDLADGAWDRVAKLRDMLEDAIATGANNTIFVGKGGPRLPNTSCFVAPGWKGETQVMQMDLAGFAVSAGSACSSGKVRASRVLRAMGFDDIAAASALRVSLGTATTEDDILRFAETWLAKYMKFRARAA